MIELKMYLLAQLQKYFTISQIQEYMQKTNFVFYGIADKKRSA